MPARLTVETGNTAKGLVMEDGQLLGEHRNLQLILLKNSCLTYLMTQASQKKLIGKYPKLEQRLASKIDEHICDSYFPNGGDDILAKGDFEDLSTGTLPARWKASVAPAGSKAKVATFNEGDNTCLSISLSDHKKDWTAFTSPDGVFYLHCFSMSATY